MRARRTAKNSIFVLHANQINIAEIQEIGCLTIRSQFILGKLEPDAGGIRIAFWRVVYRQGQQFRSIVFGVKCVAQIRGEGGDTTFAGEVISDDRDSAWQNRPWMSWKRRNGFFFDDDRIKADRFRIAGDAEGRAT